MNINRPARSCHSAPSFAAPRCKCHPWALNVLAQDTWTSKVLKVIASIPKWRVRGLLFCVMFFFFRALFRLRLGIFGSLEVQVRNIQIACVQEFPSPTPQKERGPALLLGCHAKKLRKSQQVRDNQPNNNAQPTSHTDQNKLALSPPCCAGRNPCLLEIDSYSSNRMLQARIRMRQAIRRLLHRAVPHILWEP